MDNKEVILLKGPVFKGKHKDLVNVLSQLQSIITKEYIFVLTHFQNLLLRKGYIKYSKHLGGVSHHKSLGPASRPLKTYTYIIQVLKNLRPQLIKIDKKKYNIETVLNLTGNIFRKKAAKLPRFTAGHHGVKSRMVFRITEKKEAKASTSKGVIIK